MVLVQHCSRYFYRAWGSCFNADLAKQLLHSPELSSSYS